ncbi:hypothetical protein N7493_002557 [Penicillium malachiteum]|uniref:Beta-lactamase-related domain-containing protein n=1 Tax=Penicillium malachiteum TaxID=1324776 RepID=A0AAD6HS29_9EURO|nr:hypothetical protein N7493_002557 [Penicillium malachiteum]
MAEIDAALAEFTDPIKGSIHGATFVAIDRNGNDIYRKSFGHQKVDTSESPVLTADTISWIASLTKLTSSVSVMQIVERGLIGLDDDIHSVLPELKDLKVLIGFEGEEEGSGVEVKDKNRSSGPYSAEPLVKPKGNPIMEDVQGPITLRQLISHTSGFRYDLGSPLLKQYSAWADRKENMFSGTIEGNLTPLIFQPGTSWAYGPGLDWAGEAVARLTGMSLDEYQQKYIWQPLGAKNTTFFPANRGTTEKDLHEIAERSQGAGPQNLKVGSLPWLFTCRDALGGAGLYSTANDYSKLLAALLADGGSILSKASVDEMFRPQMGAGSVAGLRASLLGDGSDNTHSTTWAHSFDADRKALMDMQHCLCGVVNTEDVRGRRRKNSIAWSGLPNLIWWIDRESGVAAVFFTQMNPDGDKLIRKLEWDIEHALYRLIDRRACSQ